VFVVSPFLALFLFAIPLLKPANWGIRFTAKEINWQVFLPVISWNLNGFDAAGFVSEEVSNTQSTYRVAYRALLVLTQWVYILPVLAGVSLSTDFADWTDGYFVEIANRLGNAYNTRIFIWWMLFGGAISAMGQMCSCLCTTSRALYGMAMLDFFPSSVSRSLKKLHHTYHTPHRSIILNGILTGVLCLFFDFDQLVGIDVSFYSFRLMLEFWALVRLRVHYPYSLRHRPFRIAGGVPSLIVLSIVPVIVSIANITVAFMLGPVVVILTACALFICLSVGVLYTCLCPQKMDTFQLDMQKKVYECDDDESRPLNNNL